MPLPATLIAAIISAIVETSAQNPAANTTQYDTYSATRTLPPEAKQGVLLPLQGNGSVVINGNTLQLSPTAQFRNQQNLIVMSMSIQAPTEVVYLSDDSGAVYRVWLVSQAEISALQNN